MVRRKPPSPIPFARTRRPQPPAHADPIRDVVLPRPDWLPQNGRGHSIFTRELRSTCGLQLTLFSLRSCYGFDVQVYTCKNACGTELRRSDWRSGHYFCSTPCRLQYRKLQVAVVRMMIAGAARKAAPKRAAASAAAAAARAAAAAAPLTTLNTRASVPAPLTSAPRSLRKRRLDVDDASASDAPSDVTVTVPRAVRAVRAVTVAAPILSPAPARKRRRRAGLVDSFVPSSFTASQRQALQHADDLTSASLRAELRGLTAEWRDYKDEAYTPDTTAEWGGLHNVKYQYGDHDPQTWQHDPSPRAPELVARTAAAVRRALPCIPDGWPVQVCKVISSDPAAPQQFQHTDLQEGHSKHKRAISVLLHLHPSRTAWVQRNQELTAKDFQYCPAVRATFHQYVADDATLFAFRTDVVHFGPANLTLHDRVLVYLRMLFTPEIVKGAGNHQTFFCKPLTAKPTTA